MEHEFGAVWHMSGVVEDPAPRLLSFSSEDHMPVIARHRWRSSLPSLH